MSTIKLIRDRLGLTQAALADKLGCTQGNVGHYERGQTVPPDTAKQLIALALDAGLRLTMDHVYGLVELPPEPKPVATPAHEPSRPTARDTLRLHHREQHAPRDKPSP